jgi:choline-sulfatase
LLAALGEQGLEGNTIVLFSADHGKLLNEWGAVGKQTFDDVSWRIPFIVRWPGELPAGTRRSDLCSLLDTGRTLLGLAGLQAPATFRGRNLFSSDPAGNAVFGQISPPDAKAPVFTDPPLNDESSPPPGAGTAMRVAIRTERHRLDTVWMNASGEIPAAQRKGNLFDLEADPLEKRNLWDAPESRMLRDELQDRLASWFASLDRPHGLFGNIGKRPEGKPALSSGTT